MLSKNDDEPTRGLRSKDCAFGIEGGHVTALLLEWFGGSPVPYHLAALAALLAFVALPIYPDKSLTERLGFECAFLASAGLTLLAWRWPTFLWQNPLNPDEALWVAGALKVTADWVPWRGFDGTTSGPLTVYTLALPAIFGGRIDFFSARIIGVCLLTATMVGLYYSVKWLAGARVARLSIFPAVLLLALSKDWNFLHFSSEIVPIFLTTTALAASAYLARDASTKNGRIVACGIAGLCLGGSALAKLQSAPLILALMIFVATSIAFAHRRRWKGASSEGLVFLFSLCLVPGAIALVLRITGEWEYAVRSYVKNTIGYVEIGARVGPSFLFDSSASYTAFLCGTLIVLAAGTGAIFWWRQRPGSRSLCLAGAALLLLIAAGFAIYIPHRPYQHYLLFSVVPLSCCVASVLALIRETDWWRRRETLIVGAYLSLFLVSALAVTLSSAPTPLVAEIASNSTRKISRQALAISRYAPPGSRVAIWGACPEYYVQTQTIMATRYGQMGPVPPGPMREYYERVLLRDLESSKPRVFVDAVHPGAFVYQDRATQGFETVPALAAFVRRNYQLKEEVAGVRIFVADPSRPSEPASQAGTTPPAPETAGWRIYFNKGGGSEIYRGSGWSGSEPDFTWSDGTVAKLILPIADNSATLSLHMKLGALVRPPELLVQDVAVYANHQKIADWQVTDDQEFTAPIPAEVTKNAAELNLELRIPNAASPQSLGLSYDGRLLGVRCYFVELRRR